MNLVFFFIGRCSASSVIFPEQIEKYTFVNMIIVILFGIGIFFSLLSEWFYLRITHRDLLRSYKSFYCCRKIFVCIVITFVCLQLTNSLSCRPIDLLYDYRYLSMLILQANGVVLTLSLAFFLGVKYATIQEKHYV